MYSVTNDFLTKVKEPSRNVKAKVVINGTTTIDESIIINFSVERSFTGNMPILGSVSAAKLSIGIINSGLPDVIVGVPIVPSVAIETSTGVYEWVQLGVFYAAPGDITKTARSLNIECFDSMPSYDSMLYVSSISYPATLEDIKVELTANYGISFSTQILPEVTFTKAPDGTVRQVLAELALNLSSNVIINADDHVEFVELTNSGFELDASNYIDFKLQSEAPIKISQLSIKNGETKIYSGDGTGFTVSFDSSNIADQDAADSIYNRVYPLTYSAYRLKTQGMPHLELGDLFTLTDADSILHSLIVINHKLSFSGGLISEFSVDAPKSETVESTPTGGSAIARAVTQARVELMQAVNNATKLITGAEGGTIVTLMDEITGKPNQLLIMNTDDINTATRVWRWNIEGLGYSSNGYLGPYALAIRADGVINADFITTGSLSADVIQVNSISNDKLTIDLQGVINSKVSQTMFDTAFGDLDEVLASTSNTIADLITEFNSFGISGPNIVQNSRGNYGSNEWITEGPVVTGYNDALSVKHNGAGNVLRLSSTYNSSSFVFQDGIILKPGTEYTLSGKYYIGSGCNGINLGIMGQRSLTLGHSADFERSAVNDTIYSNGEYKDFTYTFTTNIDEERSFLKLGHLGSVSGETFIYIVLSLNEGNKAPAWMPNPEDAERYAESAIAASASVTSTQIQQAADSIMATVSTDYFTKLDANTLETSMSTMLTQTASDFTMKFQQVNEIQNIDRESNSSKFIEIEKYIKFDNGNIILGEIGNQLTLRIENDRIGFIQEGSEVAYFSDRKLFVTDGQFIDSMRVGNFGFMPRENGNLSFRRM